TRIVMEEASTVLGQPIVVENRPGASGIIAATYVARAAADGYTLLMGNSGIFGVNPGLFKSLAYDPVKDFSPVALLGTVPFMFVVNAESSVKTLPELVAHARQNPQKLNYGSGTPTVTVWMETLNRTAGIRMQRIDYKSGLPA